MNNLIVYPLIILLFVGTFNQLYYLSNVDYTNTIDAYNKSLIGNQTLNGTDTSLELENASLELDFTMTIGLITIIIGAIALGLIGLNVLGSGLSDFSVKIIWNGIVFYGLWSIFSVLAFSAINSVIFGYLFWFFLTFIYSLGVFGRMGD